MVAAEANSTKLPDGDLKNDMIETSFGFDTIDGFTFVWFTDGKGWTSARHNLEETFDVMDNIYSIKDLEDGIITEVFK